MSLELINQGLTKIESKLHQLPELAAQQRELAERLLTLEQKGLTAPGLPSEAHTLTAGAEFARKLADGRDLFDKTGRFAVNVSTKGMITAVQVGARGSLGPTGGPGLVETAVSAVLPMPTMPGLQSLTYPRRTTNVPEGAGVTVQAGEGAAKTESTPIYTSITQGQATVAAYANVSEQALRSAGELEAAIDLHLRREVMMAVDTLLMDGTTVTSAAFAGLPALAGTAASLPGALLEQMISSIALGMRTSGYAPNVVVVNSVEWAGAAVRRAGDGHWMNGSPFSLPPLSTSGMRVALSPLVDPGKALLIDTRYVGCMVSDVMRVELGHVNDQFIKNMVTVRAEIGVIPVVRDTHAMVYASLAT